MDLILHHYPTSNFAEKVRLTLGLKGLKWHSVHIPRTAPKPDYTPLTAGYRRTPALQVGADIYCDTTLICDWLERQFPTPTLFPGPNPERTEALSRTLTEWAEQTLLWPIALSVTGEDPSRLGDDFHQDRAALHGKPTPTVQQVQRAAQRNLPIARTHVATVEAMLTHDAPFVMGDDPSLADISLYHPLWFTHRINDAQNLLRERPKIYAWMARIAALGHGVAVATTPQRALDVALTTPPAPAGERNVDADSGYSFGEPVQVLPLTEVSPASGTLVRMSTTEVVIRTHSERTGAVHVHFPRLGYRVRRI
jgi:glutathione S-transferase